MNNAPHEMAGEYATEPSQTQKRALGATQNSEQSLVPKADNPGRVRKVAAADGQEGGNVDGAKVAMVRGAERVRVPLDSAMSASYATSQQDEGPGELEVPGGVVTGVKITQARSQTKILAMDEQKNGTGNPRGGPDRQKSPPSTRMGPGTALQEQRGGGLGAESGADYIYTANVGTDPRPSEEADRGEAPRRRVEAWPGARVPAQEEGQSRQSQAERGQPLVALRTANEDPRGPLMVTNKILQPKGTPTSRGQWANSTFPGKGCKSPKPVGDPDQPSKTESQIYEDLHRQQQLENVEGFEVTLFQAPKDVNFLRNTPGRVQRKSLSRFEDQSSILAAKGAHTLDYSPHRTNILDIAHEHVRLRAEQDRRERRESQSLVFSGQPHAAGLWKNQRRAYADQFASLVGRRPPQTPPALGIQGVKANQSKRTQKALKESAAKSLKATARGTASPGNMKSTIQSVFHMQGRARGTGLDVQRRTDRAAKDSVDIQDPIPFLRSKLQTTDAASSSRKGPKTGNEAGTASVGGAFLSPHAAADQQHEVSFLQRQLNDQRPQYPTSSRYEATRTKKQRQDYMSELALGAQGAGIGTQRAPYSSKRQQQRALHDTTAVHALLKSIDLSENESDMLSRLMPMPALQPTKPQKTSTISDQYKDPKRVKQTSDKFAQPGRTIQNTFLTKRPKVGGRAGGPRQTFTIPSFLSQHMIQQQIYSDELAASQGRALEQQSMFSSELRPDTDQASIMNVLKEVQTKEAGRTEHEDQLLDTHELSRPTRAALQSSTGSNEGPQIPATTSNELRTSLASTQKRLMSQQIARKRHPGRAQGEQFMTRRLQDLERKIKSPDAAPGSLGGRPEHTLPATADQRKRESKEFHITDLLQKQPAKSLAKGIAADSGARASRQERDTSAGLPVDLYDFVSASQSHQVQPREGELAAEANVNPLFDLQIDEEFVIKNYRLIKKKKEGSLGLPQEGKMQKTKELILRQGSDPGVRPETRFSPTRHGEGEVATQSRLEGRVPSPGGTNRVNEQSRRADEEAIVQAAVAGGAQTDPWFRSKIRVSNSIISPHTYKFSTHIGPTSKMKWEQVAQIPLQLTNQDRFIRTLDGKHAVMAQAAAQFEPGRLQADSGHAASKPSSALRGAESEHKEPMPDTPIGAKESYLTLDHRRGIGKAEVLREGRSQQIKVESQIVGQPVTSASVVQTRPQRHTTGATPVRSREQSLEGDAHALPSGEQGTRTSQRREGGPRAPEERTTSASHLSKARQVFKKSCLDYWLKTSHSRTKNADLEFLKDFVDSQLAQSNRNRDLSVHQVYQKKSHETMDIEKRMIKRLQPREQVDAKVTSQERHQLRIQAQLHRLDFGKVADASPVTTVRPIMASSHRNAFQGTIVTRIPSGAGSGESGMPVGPDPSGLLLPPAIDEAAGHREADESDSTDEEPYSHLRARNVFRKEACEFDRRLRELEAIDDSYERLVQMIDHSKTVVTALDRKKGLAEIMGFELFIEDYLEETAWITQQMEDRKARGQAPLKAKSFFYHLDGRVEAILVEVLDYDDKLKKFIVEYTIPESSPTRSTAASTAVIKQSGRLNLSFCDFDTDEKLQRRFKIAQNRRKTALLQLAEERIINNELVHIYRDLAMPSKIKMGISRRVQTTIDFAKYPKPKYLQLLIMQAEALYVYETLRSVLYSQSSDPIIRKLLDKHQLRSTKALDADREGTIQPPYQIRKFSQRCRDDYEAAIGLIKADTVPGRQNLVEVIKFMMDRQYHVLAKYPLFELPSALGEDTLGYILSQKDFAANTKQSLRARLAEHPVDMGLVLSIQDCLAARFKRVLAQKWYGKIVKEVEKVVDVEFKEHKAPYAPNSASKVEAVVTRRAQIYPRLSRFFTFLNIYMERQIFDKMKESMERFLQFIIQFQARRSSITELEEFKVLGLDSVIYRVQPRPLAEIKVQIVKKKVEAPPPVKEKEQPFIKGKPRDRKLLAPEPTHKPEAPAVRRSVYKIVTVPDIDKTWAKLTSIIDDFSKRLSGIRRVEHVIFPLLEDSREFLEAPDPEKIDDLKIMYEQINWLLGQGRREPGLILARLEKYFPYFTLTYEQMIKEMKAKQFQAALGSADGVKELLRRRHVTDPAEGEKSAAEVLSEQVDKVELSEESHREKLQELNDSFWDLQLELANTYDFGLILLDVEPVKQQLVGKIDALRTQLSATLTSRFVAKMDGIYQQFWQMEDRVNAFHETIDEIIAQIDYVGALFQDGGVIDDLALQVESLTAEKDFLDSLRLRLQPDEFLRYLRMHTYPVDLKRDIAQKEGRVEEERARINKMLQDDVGNVAQMIEDCRAALQEFEQKGLQSVQDIEKAAAVPGASRELVRQAKEMKKTGEVFISREYVTANHEALAQLEADVLAIQDIVEQLHKRQQQLGLPCSEFPEADQLLEDVQPYKQLWDVAHDFVEHRAQWWAGKLSQIDCDIMETKVSKWQRSIQGLKKSGALASGSTPAKLRDFVMKEVDQVKQYLPIIQSLTAKGLEKRHYQEMSEQLRINIDPQTLTLRCLQKHKLTQRAALDAIKGVSEVAYKENAVKMAIDAIEKELKEIAFVCEPVPGKKTRVIKEPEQVLQKFDELLVKIQTLKSTQISRALSDRITKYERELLQLQTNFDNWIRVQRSWVYLEPIFGQDEVSKNLPEQCKVFEELDFSYRKAMQTCAPTGPSPVQEFCRSEGFAKTVGGLLDDVDHLEKSLNDYLDKKRDDFARLYFTSNKELVQLMGNLDKQSYLEVFLQKLFHGIAGLLFDEDVIVGFQSETGEQVLLEDGISTATPPEAWLKEVEGGMMYALYCQVGRTLTDYAANSGPIGTWVKRWPGQIMLVAMQVIFNHDIEHVFLTRTKRAQVAQDEEQPTSLNSILKETLRHIEQVLAELALRCDRNTRNSLTNFVLCKIYARDQLGLLMLEENEATQEDFNWKIQMKYNFVKHKTESLLADTESKGQTTSPQPSPRNPRPKEDGKRERAIGVPDEWDPARACLQDWLFSRLGDSAREIAELSISSGVARVPYGYEYAGNDLRLVMTPLTDRCFRSIFLSLHYSHSIALEGRPSAGKTETTKEMAKCAGKLCFVFNCSSTLDYGSLINFFKGFVSGGSWTCFDEFNRISTALMSTIAQTIMQVNQALRLQKPEITFAESKKPIKVDPHCAILVTMNTAPRLPATDQDLPRNLMSQFRSIQMVAPDTRVIVEAMLHSSGFTHHGLLAQKLMTVLAFAKDQMTHDLSHDFSLRSVKSVIQQAQNYLRAVSGTSDQRSDSKKQADEEVEQQLRAVEDQARARAAAAKENASESTRTRLQQESLGASRLEGEAGEKQEVPAESGKTSPDVLRGGHTDEPEVTVEPVGELPRTARLGGDSRSPRTPLLEESDGGSRAGEGGASARIRRCRLVLGIIDEELVATPLQMEQCILLKAINEQNLPKFRGTDRQRFRQITGDVFQDVRLRQERAQASFDKQLLRTMEKEGLECRRRHLSVLKHLHDLVVSRSGVMVIGEALGGKTRSLQLIQSAYNTLYTEEFERRKDAYLRRKSKAVQAQVAEEAATLDIMETIQREHQLGALDLTPEEHTLVKSACRHKQIVSYVVNPQAQPAQVLLGHIDDKAKEYQDGILASTMRQMSACTDDRYQWIVFDGDVATEWVDVLNSVLDDNRKLTLVSGETLPLTPSMRIIIECADLSTCSPAIISRCGILNMQDSVISPKQIFNSYLRRLPRILADQVQTIDDYISYFFPDILEKWFPSQAQEESDHDWPLIYRMTAKNAVLNFLKVFELCIKDYRDPKFEEWRTIERALRANKGDMETNVKPPAQATPPPGEYSASGQCKRQFSFFRFAEDQERTRSAVRHREQWIECFFIQSLVQAFCTLFKEDRRPHFLEHIHQKIMKRHATSGRAGREAGANNALSATVDSCRQGGSLAEDGESGASKGGAEERSSARQASERRSTQKSGAAQASPNRASSQGLSTARPKYQHRPTLSWTEDHFDALLELDVQAIPSKDFLTPSHRRGRGSGADQDSEEDYAALLEVIQSEEAKVASQAVDGNEGANLGLESAEGTGPPSARLNTEPDSASPDEDNEERDYEEPIFKLALPAGGPASLEDAYFDIDSNSWETWLSLGQLGVIAGNQPPKKTSSSTATLQRLQALSQHGTPLPDQKSALFYQFVATNRTNQVAYLLEGAALARTNFALVGEAGAGKTYLMNKMVTASMSRFSATHAATHLALCSYTGVDDTQRAVEELLEKRRKGVLAPMNNKQLVCFIDDVTMDRPVNEVPGHQVIRPQVLELIRQYLDHQQWYDLKSKERRTVEDVSFATCFTYSRGRQASKRHQLSRRQQAHFLLVGLNNDEEHLRQIFTSIVLRALDDWPERVLDQCSDRIVECTLKVRHLYQRFVKNMKAGTLGFLWSFHSATLYRILHSLACFDGPSTALSEFEIAKLWSAEAYRALLDRFKEKADRKLINAAVQALSREYFTFGRRGEQLPAKPGRPLYSHLCGMTLAELSYREVERPKQVRRVIEQFRAEYEQTAPKLGIPMFDYMAEQVIKINRAIQQPHSNVVLVGAPGLGKAALARLAIFTCRYVRHETCPTAEFGLSAWRALLREMTEAAVTECRAQVLNLPGERVASEQMLEDLSCLLKNGQLPGLFDRSTWQNLAMEIAAAMAAAERGDGGKKRQPSPGTDIDFVLELMNRTRRHVKFILSVSPATQLLTKTLRRYPTVLWTSTIIWMDDWPEEGIRDAAKAFLKRLAKHHSVPEPESQASPGHASGSSSVLTTPRSSLVECALQIHKDMQSAVKSYARATGQVLQVTPRNFVTLMETVIHLHKSRTDYYEGLRAKYNVGLEQIRKTEEHVCRIQRKLDEIAPALVEKQGQIEDLLRELDFTTGEMKDRVKFVEEEEAALEAERASATTIRDECQRQFDEAIPLLKKAIQGLKKLTKSDIVELKTIKKPSKAVYTLMQCVCIIMGVPPSRTKVEGETSRFEEDFWAPATSGKVLNNFQLVDILSNHDPEQLTVEIMQKLKRAQSDEDFNYEGIQKASKAAQGIYKWLIALQNYYYVYTECKPRRDALLLAEKQIVVQEEQIKERRQHLATLQAKLTELRDAYSSREAAVRELQNEIEACNNQNARAAKLLNALRGEKQKWSALNQIIHDKFHSVQGDCLLAAALIAYLGQFNHEFRRRYFDRWLGRLLEAKKLKVSEYWNFIKLFGDQVVIKRWIINRLPADSFSITNALMVELSPVQTIIIDPEYQAHAWIRAQSRNSNDDLALLVLNQHHPQSVKLLRACIKFGKTALLEDVGQDIDPAFLPLFDQSLNVQDGEATKLCLGGVSERPAPGFKLFATSELKLPQFSPDIAACCCFVNFSPSRRSLEAQLLSLYVNEKMSRLEDKYVDLKKKALDCIVRLQGIEELIMAGLDKEVEALLRDDQLLEHLAQSHMQSKRVTRALQVIKKQEYALQEDRKRFLPAAIRGASLFQVVADLRFLQPAYQFSLQWFLKIYSSEMKNKEHVNSALDPLVDFNNRLTKQVFQRLCVGLLQKDKLMLAFLMAHDVMKRKARREMEAHFEFIIKGPFGTEQTAAMTQNEKDEKEFVRAKQMKKDRGNPRKRKLMTLWGKWMTERHWEALEVLEHIPPFDKPNIIDHMIAHEAEWEQFIQSSKEQLDGPLPGSYGQYGIGEDEPEPTEKRKKKPEPMEEAFDLDEVFNAEDSVQRQFSSDEDGGPDQKNAEPGSRAETAERDREYADSPALPVRAAEDDDAFYKRKSLVEEDQYVGKKRIDGLPEYAEFDTAAFKEEGDRDAVQLLLNKVVLRFCVLRIFRPELTELMVKTFIELFLDSSYTQAPPFQYLDVMRQSESTCPNLIMRDASIDPQAELLRLQKVVKKECQFHYVALTPQSLRQLPGMLAFAAQSGHWVLLDNLENVEDHLPELQRFLFQLFDYQKEQSRQTQRLRDRGTTEVVDEELTREMRAELRAIEQEIPVEQGDDSRLELRMPEIEGFYLSNAFRLWISTTRLSNASPAFQQRCSKVMLEQQPGLKLSCAKVFNSTPPELIAAAPEPTAAYKRLYFILTFLHSVYELRVQFRALGWNAPYQFTRGDHHLACLLNLSLAGERQTTTSTADSQLKTLGYYVSEVIYGSHISHEEDRAQARALATTVLQPGAISSDTFNLVGLKAAKGELAQYVAPPLAAREAFGAHVTNFFPPVDRPEVFGIHFNAQVLTVKEEGAALLHRIMKVRRPAEEAGRMSSTDPADDAEEQPTRNTKRQRTKINDVAVKVPDLLPTDGLRRERLSCLEALILQEVEKYNNLLVWIQRRCQLLLACLDAEEELPDDLSEELHDFIMCDLTPPQWQKISYPCLSSLPAYLADLQDRVAYVAGLLEQKVDELYRFWVPSFFSQRALFSQLQHHAARAQRLPLDATTFKYTVTSAADEVIDSGDRAQIEKALPERPSGHCYFLYGLTSQCGRWQRGLQLFEELPTTTGRLFEVMPAIQAEVVPTDTLPFALYPRKLLERGGAIRKSKLVDFAHTQARLSGDFEIVVMGAHGLDRYHRVPLYVTSKRDYQATSSSSGFVTDMIFRIDRSTDSLLWTKRGLALVCLVDH